MAYEKSTSPPSKYPTFISYTKGVVVGFFNVFSELSSPSLTNNAEPLNSPS